MLFKEVLNYREQVRYKEAVRVKGVDISDGKQDCKNDETDFCEMNREFSSFIRMFDDKNSMHQKQKCQDEEGERQRKTCGRIDVVKSSH